MATRKQYNWSLRHGGHEIDDDPDVGFEIINAPQVWDAQVMRELMRRIDEAGSAIRYTRNYIVQNIVRRCLFDENILRAMVDEDSESALLTVKNGGKELHIRFWLEVIENDDFYRVLVHRVTVYDSDYFQVYDDQRYCEDYIWETTLDKPTMEE